MKNNIYYTKSHAHIWYWFDLQTSQFGCAGSVFMRVAVSERWRIWFLMHFWSSLVSSFRQFHFSAQYLFCVLVHRICHCFDFTIGMVEHGNEQRNHGAIWINDSKYTACGREKKGAGLAGAHHSIREEMKRMAKKNCMYVCSTCEIAFEPKMRCILYC